MEWEWLLIAVYNGRIISLKVITLSSGPRRLHFGTTGKKWAFHVVDTQWEWMDRLTEPLIGVRRSWLLSGWTEWSGLEKPGFYGLVKNTCTLPLERVPGQPHHTRWTIKLFLRHSSFQQGASLPLYIRAFRKPNPYIPSAHLPHMALGSIDSNGKRWLDHTHKHLYPSVMPRSRLRWQCFPHAMCRC